MLRKSANTAFEVHFVLAESQTLTHDLYIFSQRVTNGEYRIVQIVVFVISGAAVAFCLGLAIYGIVWITRSMKQKKKLK